MFIALLTDFGTKDYFVGAMKGAILNVNSKANIIDITHEIEPQNIRSAGFVLASCYRDFPKRTVFVAVVDPGVGSDRRAIVVETENYYFVAPDNGLLSFVLENETEFKAFELTNTDYFQSSVSQTFHGRDIFAPVGAWLTKGIKPPDFGRELKDIIRFEIAKPRAKSSTETEAEVIHIDHFGNLVTNLSFYEMLDDFFIAINGHEIRKHQTNYSQAIEGELFTIWGSAGYLEISAFKSSASAILKAETGSKISVHLTNP